MNRHQIINHIIKKNGYKRYLEIGVRKGHCFKKVVCDHKDGVDPRPQKHKVDIEYIMTSDDFFKSISSSHKYDIVFIDGLHERDQVLRDVYNSFDHLTEGGTIVMHDCNPESEYMTRFKRNGNVWEALVELRRNPNLNVKVVDDDHGVGIITIGSQEVLELTDNVELTYDFLESDRKNILNLISVEEFEKETK